MSELKESNQVLKVHVESAQSKPNDNLEESCKEFSIFYQILFLCSSEENWRADESHQESEGPEWRVGVLSALQDREGQDEEKGQENLQVSSIRDFNIDLTLPYLQCLREQEEA